MIKKIVIASDHGGYELKETLIIELKSLDYEVEDLGTHSGEVSVDYPDFGHKMANTIKADYSKMGILICGTGIGMSIVANRHGGIRAALCHNTKTARLAREHNSANVLVLGARVISEKVAKNCVRVFLETEFERGRHIDRLKKI